MHDDELALDDGLARRLIAERFPELSGLPLARLRAPGTVNTIIRVGDGLTARFPLTRTSSSVLAAEAAAMAEFADVCATAAPRPYGLGPATAAYDSAWSVQTWVEGSTTDPLGSAGASRLARDLAATILALRAAPTDGRVFDEKGRGGELTDHDRWMAECLRRSAHLLDTTRAARLWDALRVLPSAGPDVMSHRDLTPFNVLADDRGEPRLSGILDTGGFGPADRSLDLVVAWHLFDAPARAVLRRGVHADDVEWLRGAAWAFQQAMGLGWYYETSNPPMAGLGLTTMRRLLADEELAALVG